MLVLRDYQLKLVNELDKLSSAVAIAATGSGKTMIAAAASWREVQKGGCVAFVVPRDNLARQTAATFSKWGLTCGYILGGEEENRAAKVQIVSYQSLGSKARSLDWLEAQTTAWFVDECHITAFARSLHPRLMRAKGLGKRIHGVTATPWQMKGMKRSLLDVFDVPVFAPFPSELIAKGFLAMPIYFTARKGKKLEASPEFIYENWERIAFGEKSFCFAGSIAESDAIAQCFRDNGISAVSVTSRTPKKEVEPIFLGFKEGRITVLVSCNKLAEGCDIPSAQVVILANRTESKSGVIQRIGRGARVTPTKKTFKVIDCVGVVRRFGRFEELQIDRSDFDKPEPEENKEFPGKQCDNCGAWWHIQARICKNCGEEFEFLPSEREHPGEIIRLTRSDMEARAIARFHQIMLADFRQGTSTCDKLFKREYGYYPHDHWVVDAPLPPGTDSAPVRLAWKLFKQKLEQRLPKENIQLTLDIL